MNVFFSHKFMVIGRMMLGELIHPIVYSFVPIYPELPLLYSVDHPVEPHVEGFDALLLYLPIEETFGAVVCFQSNGALYVPHFV